MTTSLSSLFLLSISTLAACEANASLGTVDAIDPAATPEEELIFHAESVQADAPNPPGGWGKEDAPTLPDVTYVNGRPMVLLAQADADQVHDHGKPRRLTVGDSVVLRRNVDLTAIDPSLAAWVGQPVTLYDADAHACTANVTSLAYVGWMEFVNGHAKGTTATETWDASMQRDGVWLVAELDSDRCADARFARRATEPALSAWPHVPAPANLEAQAMKAISALSINHDNQVSFDAYNKQNEVEHPADSWDHDATREVSIYRTSEGTFVTASENVEGDCGDWGASLFAVWKVGTGGALELELQSDSPPSSAMATDVDGDGVLEFVPDDHFEAPTDSLPDDGCGC